MKNYKVVILAGGLGKRLTEETRFRPKPMILIGNKPIISHIIDIYKKYGFKDFYIAAGYKYEILNKYFKKKIYKDLNIKVVNTGKNTQTGGRILRLKKYLKNDRFLLTYGDGLSDINIKKLLNFHIKNKKEITMTIVRPPARWGFVKIKKNNIISFDEKNQKNENWINGGFMVIEPNILKKYNLMNHTVFEKDLLPKIVKNKNLCAYKHNGFWQCMDTLRDKILLNDLNKKNAPWKKL